MDEDDAGRLLPFKPLSRTKRRLVRSALEIEAEEPSGIAYQHTVLCQTCLPYRDPGDGVREWEREQGAVALKVSAGEVRNPARGGWVKLGLPYGPKPRLILAHLNREALRRGSPEVEVGTASPPSCAASKVGAQPAPRSGCSRTSSPACQHPSCD